MVFTHSILTNITPFIECIVVIAMVLGVLCLLDRMDK